MQQKNPKIELFQSRITMSSSSYYFDSTMKTIYQQRYQTLIDCLISARKQAKLTQADIAHQLGKPQSYIAKIEGKDRKIDVLEYVEICEVLDLQPSEIIKIIENTQNQNTPSSRWGIFLKLSIKA